jgi:hypothetical protein
MALNDAAVLVPGVGHIYTNPASGVKWTAAQLATYVSAGTVPSGFTELGHTDLDTILTWTADGGDTTTKGSWQNPSLRTVITSAAVDAITLNAEQVLDNDILTLFHGGGDDSVDGEFAWPDAPAAVERSAAILFLDGTDVLGLSLPKVSILRADVPSFAADDFMKLPLKFTILKDASLSRGYWLNATIGTPV